MLNGSDNENSKFAIKKWYVIDSESNGVYSRENPIKFLTRSLGSSLCDYSDAYVLVTGNVDLNVDDNHIPNNSSSFKYKSCFITNRNGVKIVVPLKYLSNFWKSLEMPLINCKVELSLPWNPNCVLCNLVGNSTFTITDAKLYVPAVTFSTEDSAKLSKLLTEGFKRPVYWNKHKIIPNKSCDGDDNVRELLDSSYQGVKRLFVLAYKDQDGTNRVAADSHRRYFLPRVKIKNCSIKIDRRNLYDQPINDSIKQ